MPAKKSTNSVARKSCTLPVASELMPGHVAIIMDGNGRWAEARGLSRSRGHEAGVQAVNNIVRACNDWGMEALTLYAFSSENWSRPRPEINALMFLMRKYLRKERDELHAENVKVMAIGEIDRLPVMARRELELSMTLTAENTGLKLVLALSYGGRNEIIRAAARLAKQCLEGQLKPQKITEENFSQALDTAGLPDPDLLIRTAGEMRISNFLLWQLSYSEYYSAKVYWPDFSPVELAAAIREYSCRERKYGAL